MIIKEINELEGVYSKNFLEKLEIFIINSNLDKEQRVKLINLFKTCHES